MKSLVWSLVLVAAMSGCWSIRGNVIQGPGEELREKFNEVVEGMDQQDVISIMGQPTQIEENILIYKYDDPWNEALIRFVLDADKIVIGKHYETAEDLSKKGPAERKVEGAEGEKDKEAYPGAALPRFRDLRNRRARN